ncbi:MAG: ABC transporter ATP-binding protein [Pseudomonadota bacterium]
MSEALALEGIAKTYNAGRPTAVEVLRGVDLTIAAGEVVALVAPSGAGKSTLLHIAGLLERPDTGAVRVAGTAAEAARDGVRTGLRRDRIGFIYQFHHLLPEFSAQENVALPQRPAGVDACTAAARAATLLDRVGLAARVRHRPAEMSGGEQQRVAFCRALANRPALILADEPTGNLDPGTSDLVFDALLRVVREEGAGALVATHNLDLAARMDRMLRLEDGRVA